MRYSRIRLIFDCQLPFSPRESYRISRGYCFPGGGHRGQLAHDFEMPVGVDILAPRAGRVLDAGEDAPPSACSTG